MAQDRGEALASVTIDSSLIYPTTSRRFLMALWEMEGLKVELLPRTIQEMYGFVQDSERSYWRRALAREAGRTGRAWPPETVEAVAAATAAAAGRWVNTEIGYAATPARNDSMLHAVGLTRAEEARAGAIAETIPNICFKGPSKDGHRGDREIVAQGVVTGFKILASDNRTSIRRPQMNGWLREQGLCTGDFVLRGDDAIEEAGPWRDQPAHLLEAALRATLPDKPGEATRENDIVATFIGRMRDEGLDSVATSCDEEWRGARHRDIYDRARRYIAGPTTLARETEHRRLTATRTAAADAGYER